METVLLELPALLVEVEQQPQLQLSLAQDLERTALHPQVEQQPRSQLSLAKEAMEPPPALRELQQLQKPRLQSLSSQDPVAQPPLQQLLSVTALACVLLDLSPCPHHRPSPSN
jgi:hypothetical protein